jgi:hypothetical protein
MIEKSGKYVHGEFFSSGTGGEITLYDRDGSAHTWNTSTERINIYWFKMTNDTACNLTLHCDTDDDNNADAGEIVCQQAVVADGGIATSMGELPFISAIGGKPHILASASGNVSCHLIGYIVTDG